MKKLYIYTVVKHFLISSTQAVVFAFDCCSFTRATKEVTRIKALPAFDQMTMETFYDMYPGVAIDPVNRPTFWPHDAEEQPGYRTADQKDMDHLTPYEP